MGISAENESASYNMPGSVGSGPEHPAKPGASRSSQALSISPTVACNRGSGRWMAKRWWWLAPVWSETDSHRYQLSEDQARRQQIEPGAFDFSVTGH